MKTLRIALFLFLAFLVPHTVYCEVIDRIVVIVNDDIITLKELEKFVVVERSDKFPSVSEYFRNIKLKEKLDVFIDNLLIKQVAKKMNIDVSDKEVESIIESIKKQNLISEDELKEQLKKENIAYEDFYEGIKLNTLRRRVLARVISPEVTITDTNLRDYYNKHVDEFRDDEYHLRQIFVSKQRPDAVKIAMRALNYLKQGDSFEEVAKNFSDDPSSRYGGDIGFAKKADLLLPLRLTVAALAPGAYSEIVETPYGFHILQLIEVKKGDTIPFDEVKKTIHAKIIQTESEKKYQDYINKLRKSSYIEVKI